MDLFMPAERVLYNRSYYFSDEAVDDYNEYIGTETASISMWCPPSISL